MTYSVVISDEAKKDLKEIYEYIAVTLSSPINASNQLDRLQEDIVKLDEMPKRFPAYPSEPWNGRGLRYLTVDNYVVFYLVNDDNMVVKVMRILYSGRNIDTILKNM